jgi:hypothetical protein
MSEDPAGLIREVGLVRELASFNFEIIGFWSFHPASAEKSHTIW